jgi:hypothetical protein
MYARFDNGLVTQAPKRRGGLGLFESGLNFDQWSIYEWLAVGVGAYLAVSLVGDVGRGRQTVQRSLRRRRSRRVAG